VVPLPSGNRTAARAPSCVTIAAGATSATLSVSRVAVASSTTVSISGAYGGVTRSAALTVTPAPPPAPTLSSLTLNPTSVVGGTSSAERRVGTEGAPSGGAEATLSSINRTAARTTSSVSSA